MTNKKFTAAAIIAAAITAAPIAATAVGAVSALPVMADTPSQSTDNNTNAFTATKYGKYYTATGSIRTIEPTIAYTDDSFSQANSTQLATGAEYNIVGRAVLSGTYGTGTYYKTSDGLFVNQSDVSYKSTTIADTTSTSTQAGEQIGTGTINYNKNYGIQIWTKDGKYVYFNETDAAAWNKNHPNNKVKAGQPKKLPGQSTWKVFKNTYRANGTTYYNLGGDQYIDANYVILK